MEIAIKSCHDEFPEQQCFRNTYVATAHRKPIIHKDSWVEMGGEIRLALDFACGTREWKISSQTFEKNWWNKILYIQSKLLLNYWMIRKCKKYG